MLIGVDRFCERVRRNMSLLVEQLQDERTDSQAQSVQIVSGRKSRRQEDSLAPFPSAQFRGVIESEFL